VNGKIERFARGLFRVDFNMENHLLVYMIGIGRLIEYRKQRKPQLALIHATSPKAVLRFL
jgi:hypothetical protein